MEMVPRAQQKAQHRSQPHSSRPLSTKLTVTDKRTLAPACVCTFHAAFQTRLSVKTAATCSGNDGSSKLGDLAQLHRDQHVVDHLDQPSACTDVWPNDEGAGAYGLDLDLAIHRRNAQLIWFLGAGGDVPVAFVSSSQGVRVMQRSGVVGHVH